MLILQAGFLAQATMEGIVLLILLLIGLTLLVLEFLVIPGIGVVGLIGFACICLEVYLGYRYYGLPGGHYVLSATLLVSIGVTIGVLRSKTWKRLGLNATIDSKVEGVDDSIRPGDSGITLGRLAPMGKVKIGEYIVEAQSQSGYVDNGSEVEVVKVFKDKIIVNKKVNK